MHTLPPLSLYIHIPWCERKCPYCDFNSHENFQAAFEHSYIQCLLDDLDTQLPFVQNRKLVSIFIGGGTPSIFKASSIKFLLTEIKKRIEFTHDIEITMEANPASSQGEYFSELSATLVNRVSLGVQSFQSYQLQALGRLHTEQDAHLALNELSKYFSNFNIDLMFGLPEQSVELGLDDLTQALQHKPKHLSWYQLTIEPNTVFYRNTPVLPDEQVIDALHQQGKQLLTQHAFQQYEISAFAQSNQQSQHNLNYWRFGDYLAIGAGAHGKITRIEKDQLKHMRFNKTRLPKDYMASASSGFKTQLHLIEQNELALEYLMNSLRLNEAISFKLFEQSTGLDHQSLNQFLEQAQNKQLIEVNELGFKKTALGERFLDSLLALVE